MSESDRNVIGEWRGFDENYEGRVWQEIKYQFNPLITSDGVDEAISELATNHEFNLEKIEGHKITILELTGLPPIIVRYRTSISGLTEAIGTVSRTGGNPADLSYSNNGVNPCG